MGHLELSSLIEKSEISHILLLFQKYVLLFTKAIESSIVFFFLFFSFFKLINLFLAALGLRFCAQAFSACGERGLLFVVVRGLLIAMASLVAEHGL